MGDCLNRHELRKALGSLPITLDDTYARILDNIPKRRSQLALKILQWLSYSARPLQIEEVAEVVAIDFEGTPRYNAEKRLLEPRDILRICSSLVTTDSDSNSNGTQVRLAHSSVKEYLVSERIQAGSAAAYRILEIPANVFIAEVCLAYLLQFDEPTSLTAATVKEFPLAGYAARYWMDHARAAGQDTGRVNELGMELLLSKGDAYVNWIRLWNPERPRQGPDITMSAKDIAPPLYYASLSGLIGPVKVLLGKGADVAAKSRGGSTALHGAAGNGHEAVIRLLLEEGADIESKDENERTPLARAIENRHETVIRLLLAKGTNVDYEYRLYVSEPGSSLAGFSVESMADAGFLTVADCK